MTSRSRSSGSQQAGQPEPSGQGGDSEVIPRGLRSAIAVTITLVWAVGIVADALSTEFELNPFVYVTMLGLAGAIFGGNFVKGMKG